MIHPKIKTANVARGRRAEAPAPAPPAPGDFQAQLDALSARVDAQQATITAQQTQISTLQTALSGKAHQPQVGELSVSFSDPPTDSELDSVEDYINQLVIQLQSN